MYMCVPNNILKVKVLQSSPSFVNPIDYSLSGSSVHEILQARVLEWAAIYFSRESFLTQESNLSLLHCRRILHHLSHQGSPWLFKDFADPKRYQMISRCHLCMVVTPESIYVLCNV